MYIDNNGGNDIGMLKFGMTISEYIEHLLQLTLKVLM